MKLIDTGFYDFLLDNWKGLFSKDLDLDQCPRTSINFCTKISSPTQAMTRTIDQFYT